MDTSWEDMRLFLAVAESGSLSAAARKLGIGQPTVSRRLVLLEESFGEALCERHSDGIRLTRAGERLVAPARAMAEAAGEWARQSEAREKDFEGTVRITASPGIAADFVVPFASELKEKYPRIACEVLAQIDYLDLGRREADIALRMRKTDQKELVVLAEIEAPIALFASPAYAAKLAPDATLRDVDVIGWAPPFENLSPRPELERLHGSFHPSFSSDDFLVQMRALSWGLGAMFSPLVEHRYFASRGLVRLPQFTPSAAFRGSLFLVVAKSALTIPKVRLVAEALAEELGHVRVLPLD